jgi:hypothetical protein
MNSEVQKCEACPPGSLPELENIRSHVGACALHWHKFAVEVGGLIVGSAVALSGFVLTRDGLSPVAGYALAIVIALLGVVGFATIRYVRRQFFVHANILRKIDTLTGVFCKVRYIELKGEMLYPEEWVNSGQRNHSEPLISYAAWAALLTPLALALVVAGVAFVSR